MPSGWSGVGASSVVVGVQLGRANAEQSLAAKFLVSGAATSTRCHEAQMLLAAESPHILRCHGDLLASTRGVSVMLEDRHASGFTSPQVFLRQSWTNLPRCVALFASSWSRIRRRRRLGAIMAESRWPRSCIYAKQSGVVSALGGEHEQVCISVDRRLNALGTNAADEPNPRHIFSGHLGGWGKWPPTALRVIGIFSRAFLKS